MKKYKPDIIISLVDKKVALNKMCMNSNEDPKKLFERIKAVKVRCNTKIKKISKADKITIVLSQVLKTY